MAFAALWRGAAESASASVDRGDLVNCLSPLQQQVPLNSTRPSAPTNNFCPRINRHRHLPNNPARTFNNNSAGDHLVNEGADVAHRMPMWKSWTKKYVILCCLCGGTAVLLGVIFLVIYFVLNHYTTSLQYFETIPTYAPALVLIVTGLLVMCFARRRNRYAYLIKVAGGCCLMCALLCVLITVTTTVVHMNRLQTLRECVYTKKSKTCTCFAGIGDDEGAARYVFNDTPDCEVVHGGLYTCLRAMFGLSVVGILVCIFSSMLVYQLLSHEKKKMYWEQLEMRRRFFYRQSTHPLYCNCYDDYGFTAPTPHDLYHWQSWEVNSDRCWPARDIAPRLGFGMTHDDSGIGCGSQRSILIGSTGHRASGWNWLPWSRSRPSRENHQTGSSVSPMIVTAATFDNRQTDESNTNNTSIHHNHHSFPTTYWSVDQSVPNVINNQNGTVNRNVSVSRRGHRRRRSNDAIFHHMNMTPPFVTDASYAPSYATYGNLSHHHLWGPPPPYSRPPSAENVITNTNNNTPRNRVVNGPTHPIAVIQQPLEIIQTSDEEVTSLTANGRLHHHGHQLHQENKSISTDIFVDMHDSSYQTTRGNKRIHEPDWTSTVPPPSRPPQHQEQQKRKQEQRTTHSESNCSKSTSHIPQICIWPSDSCLVDIVSDAVIHKEIRRGLPVTNDNSESSEIEPSSSSSIESFDVDDDEDDDVGSNYRTSMMVSSAPSTPSFSTDMTLARSLPNLNLTLGPLDSVDNADGPEVETFDSKKCQEQIHDPIIDEVQFTVSDKKEPFPVRIQCQQHGMSDSSPALPLSVPAFFRTEKQNDAHKYLSSIENLFQRHCAANYLDTTSGGLKSKSLGNLSPKENIIVTSKSIHV